MPGFFITLVRACHCRGFALRHEAHLLDKLGENIIYISKVYNYDAKDVRISLEHFALSPPAYRQAGAWEPGRVRGNFEYFRIGFCLNPIAAEESFLCRPMGIEPLT